ncbi:Pirin family protein [Candida albicans]|uniref:Pirin family protein n=1 Tax=Candida albicans TaxID=5476 RepID=A0A8H6F0G1_CANAX|nr:Pirin family protein [Candida albicans]
MSARSIAKIVTARQQAEGVGARVRRSIGVINQKSFNPFLMFDHFSSSGTNGFPEHPHRGQETITLVLHGAMAHEDFTGSKGILYAGDLQFMTAGKGIVHSEMPVANEDGSPTVGLQLWVDLPDALKDTEPRYRDLREWEIPQVVTDDGKVTIKVISGRSHGIESIKELAYTPINYYYYKVKAGVVHYGPFVADCEENIEHAIIDYQYAQNGFENRKTWKTLISDGVTKDMIEGPLDGNLDKREATKKSYLESKQ